MISKADITGIVLAGGKSSRMGTEKGLLNLNGKTFVEASLSAMNPLVSETIIVSSNEDYDIFDCKRVEDLISNSGPLAGIYSGLYYSKTKYNLVLSCDIPVINTEVLEELTKVEYPDVDVVQVVSRNKEMPLIALYHRRCKRIFSKLLENNERRMRVALNQCNVKNIILNTELEEFTANINTPEDLKLLEHEAVKD